MAAAQTSVAVQPADPEETTHELRAAVEAAASGNHKLAAGGLRPLRALSTSSRRRRRALETPARELSSSRIALRGRDAS